jgi:hypothetical protein
MAITKEMLAAAEARAERTAKQTPAIKSAKCTSVQLTVTFETGVSMQIPTKLVEGLAGRPTSQLDSITISPMGTGLYFPAIDADVYVPSLLKGIFGSKLWMSSISAELGASGGRSTSPAKRQAAAANGARGGRPRKQPA